MFNVTKKTLACTLLSAACLIAAPLAVTAQESSQFQSGFIDVFNDGTLFITYEEYLERQRLVEARRTAAATAPATRPVAPRRAPITAQVARSTDSMALRDQWQIGAFR